MGQTNRQMPDHYITLSAMDVASTVNQSVKLSCKQAINQINTNYIRPINWSTDIRLFELIINSKIS